MRCRLVRILPIVAAAVLSACAEVGRPPGGPPDRTPPELTEAEPGSLAVGVDARAPLRLTFSEKVDRRRVARTITVVPEVDLEKPRFDDTTVELRPRTAWPADTVVVWTIEPDLPDKAGVKFGAERQGAFTTGASFPDAVIRGKATLAVPPEKETDWTKLRADLDLPLRENERRARRWRSASGDATGAFELEWLDRPSGPFDLTVYLDENGNRRRDEREPVAEVDSLFLTATDSIFVVESSLLRLVDLEGPVDYVLCFEAGPADSLRVVVWVRGEDETRPRRADVDSTRCVTMSFPVGEVVFGAWEDGGDGRFGVDSTGVTEAFLWPDTLVVRPAEPDTIRLAWPSARISQAELDSLRSPPVPPELSSGPTGEF